MQNPPVSGMVVPADTPPAIVLYLRPLMMESSSMVISNRAKFEKWSKNFPAAMLPSVNEVPDTGIAVLILSIGI